MVLLEADFADLFLGLLEACDWKAGALRARRAAEWVGGSVFVRVVVVLGTELVLVVRSEGCSCVSDWGAWVMMAGMDGSGSGRVVVTASVLLLLAALLAVLAAVPQRVERTPRAIDWRVVVAGVRGCGSEVAALELLESAKLAVAVGA